MDIIKRITDEIYPGWKNLILNKPEHAEMATERVNTCLDCEFLGKGVLYNKCGQCGCPIQAKVFSPKSKCPENKWK